MNTERKNITQPADWWAAFGQAARQADLTLSEWVGHCCAGQLPNAVREELSTRPPAYRPAKLPGKRGGGSFLVRPAKRRRDR